MSVMYPTESNYQAGSIGGNVSDSSPYVPQIFSKCLWRTVCDLTRSCVRHCAGTADEPVAQPLVGNIGPHPIVRGRSYNPLDSSGVGELGCSAVALDDDSAHLRSRASIVAQCPLTHYREYVHLAWRKISRSPEPDCIVGLRRIGPGHLIRQIGVFGLSLWTVKSAQEYGA